MGVKTFHPRRATNDCTAEWSAVVELADRYPSLSGQVPDGVKSSLEAGMEWQRGALLKDFKGVFGMPGTLGRDVCRPGWLKERREAYVKLLARI
jgi:hypothetical protein